MRNAMMLLPLLVLGFLAPACTFGDEQHRAPARAATATGYGSPGKARDVSRTIEISLRDTMRIEPAQMSVKQGETLRLRIRNTGAVPHEFVLGTKEEIDEHREMMKTMPKMRNDEANAVSIQPGASAELLWRFGTSGTFFYACLIPGHWEAGMQGTATVTPSAKTR